MGKDCLFSFCLFVAFFKYCTGSDWQEQDKKNVRHLQQFSDRYTFAYYVTDSERMATYPTLSHACPNRSMKKLGRGDLDALVCRVAQYAREEASDAKKRCESLGCCWDPTHPQGVQCTFPRSSGTDEDSAKADVRVVAQWKNIYNDTATSCFDEDIETGGDPILNDAARILHKISTSMACQKKCVEQEDCKAFAFNRKQGTCSLKRNQLFYRRDVEFVSGPRRCQEDEQVTVIIPKTTTEQSLPNQQDINTSSAITSKSPLSYSGNCFRDGIESGVDKNNLLAEANVKSAEACQLLCQTQNLCEAFNFLAPSQMCYLKESVYPVRSNSALVAGPRRCPEVQTPYSSRNYRLKKASSTSPNVTEPSNEPRPLKQCKEDMRGVELGLVQGDSIGVTPDITSVAACRHACQQFPGCVAFSLLAVLRECYLKSSWSTQRPNSDLISGVMCGDDDLK